MKIYFTIQMLPTKTLKYVDTYMHNISCNTDTSGLPDMYTRIPRATDPRDEGVHIRQTTLSNARVTTVI